MPGWPGVWESGPPWPDLMLIDGGRSQLAVVERALADAGKADFFPLAAIAKARDEAGHADRRAGNVADRIFLPGRSNPLPLREGCAELLFLQNVRDATHRFAIGRHRKARGQAALSGELMRLPRHRPGHGTPALGDLRQSGGHAGRQRGRSAPPGPASGLPGPPCCTKS